MRLLKSLLPSSAKLWIKERGTTLLNVPWNRFDVPVSLMNYLPRRESINMIDVGASQGDFTAAIQDYCGLRKAVLIEPQPKRVEELRARFPGPNYSVICAAAAAESHCAAMELLSWDYSSSLLPLRKEFSGAYAGLDMNVRETITVQTNTLDELCKELTGPVDLLKIDVQGAESQVIAGAGETLKRVRIIWMEVSFKPLYVGSETIEGMIRLCNEKGFVLTHLEEGWHSRTNGELLQADALFVHGLSTPN